MIYDFENQQKSMDTKEKISFLYFLFQKKFFAKLKNSVLSLKDKFNLKTYSHEEEENREDGGNRLFQRR